MSREVEECGAPGWRRAAVSGILAQLGLAHVADALVGGAARRGISGGERKRLAVVGRCTFTPPSSPAPC